MTSKVQDSVSEFVSDFLGMEAVFPTAGWDFSRFPGGDFLHKGFIFSVKRSKKEVFKTKILKTSLAEQKGFEPLDGF